MSTQGILLVDIIGFGLIILLINLLRTKRLHVGYALIWIGATLASMVVVSVPPLLKGLPTLVGAVYPASALSLIAFVFIFVVLIFMSVKLSELAARQTELIQSIAIRQLEYEKQQSPDDPNESPES